ncbi:hypothetical protein JL722_14403 [Aureococcus anophagefferens]|nr:hypothetical protein JL722_14403 [Aureococcus anophagefferens]
MASRKRRRDGDALDALAAAADAIGFDARAFERDGFAFLDNYALGERAGRALASALALRRTKEFASFNDADRTSGACSTASARSPDAPGRSSSTSRPREAARGRSSGATRR